MSDIFSNEVLALIFEWIDLETYCSVIMCSKAVYQLIGNGVGKYSHKDVFSVNGKIYVYTFVGKMLHGPYIVYKCDANSRVNSAVDGRVDSAVDNIMETGNYFRDKLDGIQLIYSDNKLIAKNIYSNNFIVKAESYVSPIKSISYQVKRFDGYNNQMYLEDGICIYTAGDITIRQVFASDIRSGDRIYIVDGVEVLTVIFGNDTIVGAKYYDKSIDFNTVSEFGFTIGGKSVQYKVSNGQCNGVYTISSENYSFTGNYTNGRRNGLFVEFEQGLKHEWLYNDGRCEYSKLVSGNDTVISADYYRYAFSKVEITARYGDIEVNTRLKDSVVINESIYKVDGHRIILDETIKYDNGVIDYMKKLVGRKYMMYRRESGVLIQYGYQYLDAINIDSLINGFSPSEYFEARKKYCMN